MRKFQDGRRPSLLIYLNVNNALTPCYIGIKRSCWAYYSLAAFGICRHIVIASTNCSILGLHLTRDDRIGNFHLRTRLAADPRCVQVVARASQKHVLAIIRIHIPVQTS